MSEQISGCLDEGRRKILARRPIDVHIGKRLTKRREEVGLCCRSLAQKLALDEADVRSFESGSIRIEPQSLYSISQILGTRISFFFAD